MLSPLEGLRDDTFAVFVAQGVKNCQKSDILGLKTLKFKTRPITVASPLTIPDVARTAERKAVRGQFHQPSILLLFLSSLPLFNFRLFTA